MNRCRMRVRIALLLAPGLLALLPLYHHNSLAAPAYGAWSAPENLGVLVNTEFAESGPHTSKDGRTLYFSSTRPALYGSFGAEDLWVSQRASADAPWGAVESSCSAIARRPSVQHGGERGGAPLEWRAALPMAPPEDESLHRYRDQPADPAFRASVIHHAGVFFSGPSVSCPGRMRAPVRYIAGGPERATWLNLGSRRHRTAPGAENSVPRKHCPARELRSASVIRGRLGAGQLCA